MYVNKLSGAILMQDSEHSTPATNLFFGEKLVCDWECVLLVCIEILISELHAEFHSQIIKTSIVFFYYHCCSKRFNAKKELKFVVYS